MNIHFPQVERRSQLFSYLLAAFATFTMLMLALGLSSQAEIHLSIPSVSMQATGPVNSDVPVAIPAPLPPMERAEAMDTLELTGNSLSIPVPQTIPAPVPSVP